MASWQPDTRRIALSKEVLGFTNRWYASALEHATTLSLPAGESIRVITAPFFLGTKMEAFHGRGKMDYQASHDLEDFVAIILPSLYKPCSLRLDFSTCFLVSSWTRSEYHSSVTGSGGLQKVAAEEDPRRQCPQAQPKSASSRVG